MPSFAFLLSLAFVCGFVAGSRNVTVDNAAGGDDAPKLSGDTQWRSRTSKDDCQECRLKPDPAQMLGSTWLDGTTFNGHPSSNVTINFNGCAIYVYVTLAGMQDAICDTHLRFWMDGKMMKEFDHTPEMLGYAPFQYRVPVYANPSFANGLHTLVIENRGDKGAGSALLLDYVEYTTEEPLPPLTPSPSATNTSPSSPSGTPNPPPPPLKQASRKHALMIGLASGIGVCVLLTLLALAWFFWMRRRLRTKSADLATDFDMASVVPPVRIRSSYPQREGTILSMQTERWLQGVRDSQASQLVGAAPAAVARQVSPSSATHERTSSASENERMSFARPHPPPLTLSSSGSAYGGMQDAYGGMQDAYQSQQLRSPGGRTMPPEYKSMRSL